MPTFERSYVRDFTLPDDFGWCRRVEPVSMAAHASYRRGNAACGMARVDSRGVTMLLDCVPAAIAAVCTSCADFLEREGLYDPRDRARQASFTDVPAGGPDRGQD